MMTGKPSKTDVLGRPTTAYGAQCDKETVTPVIVLHPGRISGEPTIGHSRLSAALIADTYWWHGADEVKSMWDYLTDADILVCCWYSANHGTRGQRSRWKAWRPTADRLLWSSETLTDCPWPPSRDDQ